MWTSQLIDFHEGGVFRGIRQKELRLFILFFVDHWRTWTGTGTL